MPQMSQSDWLFVFAAGQFGIDLLLFFGLDIKRIKTAFPNMTEAGKSRLILVLLIGGFISTAYGLYVAHTPMFNNDTNRLTVVENRKFFNEVVLLDNHRYQYCEFTNVTFKYDGTGIVQMEHNQIHGNFRFDTNSGAVFVTTGMLKAFGLLPKDFRIEAGPNRTPADVEPPNFKPQNQPPAP